MLDEKNLNEVPSQDPVEVKETVKDNASSSKRSEKKAKKKEQLLKKIEAKKAKKSEKVTLTFEEKKKIREEKAEAKKIREAISIARYIRMSPLKVNIVLDLIRGKNVEEAMNILKFTPKDAAVVVGKVLKSAVANAENNMDMNRDALYVTECHVGPGPIIKRFQPHAQGRAFSIMKRTSHITVKVAERA